MWTEKHKRTHACVFGKDLLSKSHLRHLYKLFNCFTEQSKDKRCCVVKLRFGVEGEVVGGQKTIAKRSKLKWKATQELGWGKGVGVTGRSQH